MKTKILNMLKTPYARINGLYFVYGLLTFLFYPTNWSALLLTWPAYNMFVFLRRYSRIHRLVSAPGVLLITGGLGLVLWWLTFLGILISYPTILVLLLWNIPLIMLLLATDVRHAWYEKVETRLVSTSGLLETLAGLAVLQQVLATLTFFVAQTGTLFGGFSGSFGDNPSVFSGIGISLGNTSVFHCIFLTVLGLLLQFLRRKPPTIRQALSFLIKIIASVAVLFAISKIPGLNLSMPASVSSTNMTSGYVGSEVWIYFIYIIGMAFWIYTESIPGWVTTLFFATGMSTLYDIVLTRQIAGYIFSSPVQVSFLTSSTFIQSTLIFLSVGFSGLGALVSIWAPDRRLSDRFQKGVFAGLIASHLIFMGAGAYYTGIVAQSPLYGIAYSRLGYEGELWVAKLATSVLDTTPWFVGIYALLIVGGTLITSLIAMLIPGTFFSARDIQPKQNNPHAWTMLDQLRGALLLGLAPAAAVWIAVMSNLTTTAITTAERMQMSIEPYWEWPSLGVTVLQMILFLVLVAWHERRLNQATQTGLLDSAYIVSGGTILYGVIFCFFSSSIYPLILGIVVVAFGVRMLQHQWRILGVQKNVDPLLKPLADWLQSATVISASLWANFLPQLLLVDVALSLVLISVVMIVELDKTGTPPGEAWLHQIFSSYFQINALITNLFGSLALFGVFLTLILMDFVSILQTKISWTTVRNWLHLSRIAAQWLAERRMIKAVLSWWKSNKAVAWVLQFLHGTAGLLALLIVGLLLAFWMGNFGLVLLGLGVFALLMFTPAIYRLGWPGILMAFVIWLVGWLELVPDPYKSAYLILNILAVLIILSLIYRLSPFFQSSTGQVIFVVVLLLVVGLNTYLNTSKTETVQGTSRFANPRWNPPSYEETRIKPSYTYLISKEKDGSLWLLESGSSSLIRWDGATWEQYSLPSATSKINMVQDTQNRRWILLNDTIALIPQNTQASENLIPSRPMSNSMTPTNLTQPTPDVEMLGFSSPAGISILPDDSIWIAAQANYQYGISDKPTSIVQVLPGDKVNDSRWNYLGSEDIPVLFSSYFAQAVTSQGDLWLASNQGVTVRRGKDASWESYSPQELIMQGEPSGFFVQKNGTIWVSSYQEVRRFENGGWIQSPLPEYIDSIHQSTFTFFEDSQGTIWMMSAQAGAFRWNATAENWDIALQILPDPSIVEKNQSEILTSALALIGQESEESFVGVTVMDEDAQGVLWLGGPNGLMRYTPSVNRSETFYPSISGMPTANISSLAVDSANVLWVSGKSSRTVTPNKLPFHLVVVALLGVFLSLNLRRYQQAPERRALLLMDNLNSPHQALPLIYRTLRTDPQAAFVLRYAAQNAPARMKSASGIGLSKTFSVLLGDEKTGNEILSSLVEQLERATDLEQAADMLAIYRLCVPILESKQIRHIADWACKPVLGANEKVVALMLDGQVSLQIPNVCEPVFVRTLSQFSQLASLGRRYLQVEALQDKLIYLSDALSLSEMIIRDSQQASLPDRSVLHACAVQWNSILRNEFNSFSGQADIRVELRTKQIRRENRATLVAQITNVGRATAEAITIRLSPGSLGFSDPTPPEYSVNQLEAGGSRAVEFSVRLEPDSATIRVSFDVHWSDRAAQDRYTAFADEVSFYQTGENFADIPNPYIVGLPIRQPEMFFGRDDALEFLKRNLSSGTPSRTIVLYGQRRTGKTSILYRLLSGELGPNFIPVLVDMQALVLTISSNADFLFELAYSITREVKRAGTDIQEIPENEYVSNPTRAFNRFVDLLQSVLENKQILLMLDEFEIIEEKITSGVLSSDLLTYLRSQIQHQPVLAFMFTGTHRLEEMNSGYWSVFFNLTVSCRISFLTSGETRRLIQEPVTGHLAYDSLAVDKIAEVSNCHPYFTQLLCWAVINHCNEKRRNYCTLNDVNDVLEKIALEGSSHFAFIWQQANYREKITLTALANVLESARSWAGIDELLPVLAQKSIQIGNAELLEALETLHRQEILDVNREGILRYRYRIPLIHIWIRKNQSLELLAEQK